MRSIVSLLLLGSLPVLSIPTAVAQDPKIPLPESVKVSIERGVKFLKAKAKPDGSFEVDLPSVGIQGGWTSLAVLALLNAGVPANDPAVKDALDYLRKLTPKMTYVRALQTMAFAEAGQPQDKDRIRKNVEWLIESRVMWDGKFAGWGYSAKGNFTDNSNSQYAVMGLWAGKQAGIKINRNVWESIREYYVRTQEEEGGWTYSPGRQVGAVGGNSSLTMTIAGLRGLLLSDAELNVGREGIQADRGGIDEEEQARRKALNWIGRKFQIDLPQRTFYHLFGIERTGRLTGQRFLAGHDWYREGCRYLVEKQGEDGSFTLHGAWNQWPVVSTSFALMFLAKGRMRVLVE